MLVLIVDDIAEQRDIYSALLSFHGYTVLEAGDGAEALRLAKEHRPDVVVMDVMLPVLDGWKATERLKADPLTAGIPVIVLTARALEADQQESLSAGADCYLSKPCDPREVLKAIQSVAESSKDSRSVVHRTANMRFSPDSNDG